MSRNLITDYGQARQIDKDIGPPWILFPIHSHFPGGQGLRPNGMTSLIDRSQEPVHPIDPYSLVLCFINPFGLYSPPLAASSSFRRKPESRRPDWIPHQVRNDRI